MVLALDAHDRLEHGHRHLAEEGLLEIVKNENRNTGREKNKNGHLIIGPPRPILIGNLETDMTNASAINVLAQASGDLPRRS